ncbi:MAG TPA: acylphosphatase [Elusimicrobia bacterium]|nr:MAG: hypothetical protein A2278_03860 [Elusimicrobia bacterium RIFOXYA12_FULL_49_49]OGS10068.1 MAG: hypothetical protein A2204_07875 [Elusimicrobia bacterium RIFOXYA1_FULL_47_7]OGS15297.1 MAG: hypothetical protein A2251_07175 [Elusimicrobia bacterium RIFOXYA2_FULL_47_53]OGS26549.1 MAG: hypothetical protein A2339_06945 [Elusimicrobia bacterium RIFOXYB12_FULL_50_12]OGS30552.1 MAG: hypothetical protein A2323_02295 [Elusimicrobia bacterium RIFOXYB2_FULL_46_23]HBU68972.1 acylphosphatase [Elusimi
MPETKRYKITCVGLVQGIGYRWFVQEAAQSAGISGSVRNLSNGAVEVEAQGSAKEIDTFILQLKTGHPRARVEKIELLELPPQNATAGFEIIF